MANIVNLLIWFRFSLFCIPQIPIHHNQATEWLGIVFLSNEVSSLRVHGPQWCTVFNYPPNLSATHSTNIIVLTVNYTDFDISESVYLEVHGVFSPPKTAYCSKDFLYIQTSWCLSQVLGVKLDHSFLVCEFSDYVYCTLHDYTVTTTYLAWSFTTSLNRKVTIWWGFFRQSAPMCASTASDWCCLPEKTSSYHNLTI